MVRPDLESKPLTVAIAGMGLLGTSLSLSLAHSSWRRIVWARNAETRKWCSEHVVADQIFDSCAAMIREADLVVLALPIPVIVEFLERYADDFKPGAIVTDIGSDKGVIVSAAQKFLAGKNVRFVGSHPMAGTEKNGCEAAFAELYDNAEIFLTPTESSDPEAVETLKRFWLATGAAAIHCITPEAHDSLVAHTSHISHLLALALTLTVLDGQDATEELLRYAGCATGFRDTSRIASSSPAMWRQIIENNQSAVLDAARRCEAVYHKIVQTIEQKDFDGFEALFAQGKLLRDAWMDYKKKQKEARMH